MKTITIQGAYGRSYMTKTDFELAYYSGLDFLIIAMRPSERTGAYMSIRDVDDNMVIRGRLADGNYIQLQPIEDENHEAG